MIQENDKGDVTFTQVQPKQGYEFKKRNGKVTLGFTGLVNSRKNLEGKTMEIYIFKNNQSDFQKDQYLLKDGIKFWNDSQYTVFKWSDSRAMEAGLYYYYFKAIDSEQIYYTGKFLVKGTRG